MQPKYVYLIEAKTESMVKIGAANDVFSRLSDLQMGSFVKLDLVVAFPNSGWCQEKRLHRRFRKWRVRGEWFRFAPEIRDLAEKILSTEPEEELVLPKIRKHTASALEKKRNHRKFRKKKTWLRGASISHGLTIPGYDLTSDPPMETDGYEIPTCEEENLFMLASA